VNEDMKEEGDGIAADISDRYRWKQVKMTDENALSLTDGFFGVEELGGEEADELLKELLKNPVDQGVEQEEEEEKEEEIDGVEDDSDGDDEEDDDHDNDDDGDDDKDDDDDDEKEEDESVFVPPPEMLEWVNQTSTKKTYY
jgi:hypothetical protein